MNKMFGTKHIILLAISLALIIGLYFLSKKLRHTTICKILFIIAIICEIVKTFFYVVKMKARIMDCCLKTTYLFNYAPSNLFL